MRSKSREFQESFINLPGSRSCILTAGAGRPIVIIPSMMVRAQSYRETMLELASRGFAVTVAEAPGSGRSTGQRKFWSFDDYDRWFAAMLERLDIRDATVVAHSNSGPVAMLSALRTPQRVARVVLADSVGADRAHSLIRILWGRAWDAALEPVLSITRGHHVILNVVRHWSNFWHQVRACVTADMAPVARRMRQPVLLAWGRRDHTMPLRCLRAFEDLFCDGRTYLSAKGSHDWIITNAPEFAEAVAHFVRSTPDYDSSGSPVAISSLSY